MIDNTNLISTPLFNTAFNEYQVDTDLYISPSCSVRDLGIIMSSNVSWENHILMLHKAAIKLSAWILNIFHTRDKSVLIPLFNSLVRSKLEYCCQIWDPSQIKLIDLLEDIQRSFTRKIKNMYNFDYWTRLKKLGILSLQHRRERLIINYPRLEN